MPKNESPPRVSVVTPAYNAERYLEQMTNSVRAQTLTDWEMLIINDGSVDNTENIARKFAAVDPRITLINQKNRGQSAAQNRGIAVAQAGYVLLLDADDLLASDALERLVKKLDDSPNAIAVYGQFEYLSEDGSTTLPSSITGNRALPQGCVVEALLISNFIAACGSVLFRKDTGLKVGGLSTELVIGQDWEFWLRLALKGNFVVIEGKPVFYYRLRSNSVSHKGGKRPKNYDTLRTRLFENREVREQISTRRLSGLRRKFEATTLASSGRDALNRRAWTDASRYYLASLSRLPFKPTRWLLLTVSFIRWAPPSLAKKLGINR